MPRIAEMLPMRIVTSDALNFKRGFLSCSLLYLLGFVRLAEDPISYTKFGPKDT
jgi:hypothetical protein